MIHGIPRYLAGDIAGEVVPQATDDARDRRDVCGGQAADGKHDIIVQPLNAATRPPSPDSPGAGQR
jgi:hypothetical protein